MLFVLYAAIAVSFLTMLFYFVVYPFVCMIECGLSKQLSGGTKVMWIVATFLTGVIGALAYTFFGMQSIRLRKMAISGAVVGACSLAVSFGIGAMQPDLAKKALSFVPASEVQSATANNFSFEQTLEQAGVDVTQLEGTIAQVEDTVNGLKQATQETIDNNLTKLAPAEIANYWNSESSATESEEPTPEGLFTSQSENAQRAGTEPEDNAASKRPLTSILQRANSDASGDEASALVENKPTRGNAGSPPPIAKSTANSPSGPPAVVNRYTSGGFNSAAPPAAAAPINRYTSRPANNQPLSQPAPIRNRYTNQ